ncbi:MAG: histidine kinase [Ignavibacteriales bacterium CG_4_9_14_3_um_filter_34_10]|nr:MAG: histidine kinase [Ignavibacteriales bacterium CG_4_9_14_3_um_filter_34_10]
MINEIKEESLEKIRRKSYLLNIRNLPPIPNVIIRLSQLLDDSMTPTHEIGRIISQDQALTTKILTVANSPLYGLPRKVPSIDFAILVLGFEQIKQIVIALSLIDTFKNDNSKFWNRKSFWTHSFITALLSKAIASDTGYPKTGEAFTAGLLHDLGISVLQKYFNKEFIEINDLVTSQTMSFHDAELKVLDLTHEEVGRILCDKWNLPNALGESIFCHHKPSEAKENPELSSIIHLADYATQVLDLGKFIWDENFGLDENVVPLLKLGNKEYLDKFLESYKSQIKQQLEASIF